MIQPISVWKASGIICPKVKEAGWLIKQTGTTRASGITGSWVPRDKSICTKGDENPNSFNILTLVGSENWKAWRISPGMGFILNLHKGRADWIFQDHPSPPGEPRRPGLPPYPTPLRVQSDLQNRVQWFMWNNFWQKNWKSIYWSNSQKYFANFLLKIKYWSRILFRLERMVLIFTILIKMNFENNHWRWKQYSVIHSK